MKKRKGFISIIALILMYVILSMVLYLGYISKIEYLIVNGSNHRIQSYYQSEGKIYLALYDEKYYLDQLYLNILDVFRTNNFGTTSKKVIINDEDLNFGDDIKDIIIKFIDKDNRINMNIVANSNVNGVKSKLESSGTIVNKLFEMGYPILYPNILDEKYKGNLKDLLKVINENISIHNCYKSEDMFALESTSFNRLVLEKEDKDNYTIYSTREAMENPHIEGFNKKEIFIVAKKNGSEKLEFLIGNPNLGSNNIELSGILYVEGDIIISSKFEFKGIIIVKDGKIINTSINKPKIYGLVIADDIENYNDFVEKNNIIGSKYVIYKYGTYLPGFLDPQLTMIKTVGN